MIFKLIELHVLVCIIDNTHITKNMNLNKIENVY